MAYIQPFQTPPVAKTTTPNPTSDYITIWEAASGQWKTINKETFIEDQIVRQATPFSGAAPAAKEIGIDTSTGNFYFKNASGNWEAQPVGTTVNLIDNNDGTLTINAGLGGTQKTIRPTNELNQNTTPIGTDQLAVLQAGEYKSLDLASLPISTATQTALNLKANSTDLTSGLATKENTIATGTTGQYYRGDKTFQTLDKTSVGLANVDNTSDLDKPISTAQAAINTAQTTINADTATALGLKQDKSSFAVPSIVPGDATTTQKILITDQASTATNTINVDALFATTPLKNATGQIIMTAGNVRYGTTVPSVIAGTDNKNDTYIQNSTGAFGGVLTNTFVFDGSNWVAQANSGVLSVGVEAGSTTNTGTAINPVIGLATVGTPGTYNQVTTDTKGRVATATNVAAVNSVLAVGTTPNANGATITGTGSSTTLQLQPSNATNPGILTAADWNTFNNKLASIATSTGTTGLTVTPTTTAGAVTQVLAGTLTTTNGGTGLTAVGTVGQVLTSNGTTLSYTTPANNDFFRSGTGTTLPDGTTDTTEKVSRIGQTGFGVVDASTVGAMVDNFGTLTTRSITISNGVATLTLSAAQVDANSTLKVIQTVVDTIVTIASPVTSVAAGRFLRLHNDNTSAFNISYTPSDGQARVIKPGTFLDLQWNGSVWAGEAIPVGGNMINALSNVTPATVMNVGGLFEIAMPASVDVQIRGLVARQVYILSEGEYPGGSFSTSTAAIVNLTTAFVPADNNVHVAGERNIITIQDVLTNRVFRVTVWRFGAIAGNWSGWVEEIGVAASQILTAGAGITLNNGVIATTAGTTTRAMVRASTASGVATATGAIITFGTEELDTTNSFNPTTGTFTAPRTGQYRISCQFLVASSAAGIGSRFGVFLSTNGLQFGAGSPIFSYFVSTANPGNVAFGGSYIKTLSAGSTLTFRALLDTAAGMSLSANPNFDYITIEEISATF